MDQLDPNEHDPVDPNEHDPVDPDPSDPVDPDPSDPDPVDPDPNDPADPEHAEGRAQSRVQRLANERRQEREARIQAEAEAKTLREQAEFYRRQAEQLAQQRQTPPPAEEYLDPDEKWRRESQAMLQRGLAQTADLNDKAQFALDAASNPLKAKYRDRVEAELTKARAGGWNPPREEVFLRLLGQDTAASYGKKTPSAIAAERRVTAARGQPVAARSDVQPQRGGKTAEERLRGVLL